MKETLQNSYGKQFLFYFAIFRMAISSWE